MTNSITRDAAVTAGAALSLQVESDGRAVLGIGRGDSSVQRIGRSPDSLTRFARYLEMVQGYLSGGVVDRDGFASRLEWLPQVNVAKVPLEVAATGPRVIALAARHAQRICFAVGADPAHLAAAHTAGIDDAFVDWFAIAGPLARALPRFRQLAALGSTSCTSSRARPGSRARSPSAPSRPSAAICSQHWRRPPEPPAWDRDLPPCRSNGRGLVGSRAALTLVATRGYLATR